MKYLKAIIPPKKMKTSFNQFQKDTYFLIAKTRNKEISKNINDFIFINKTENGLIFKNKNNNNHIIVDY